MSGTNAFAIIQFGFGLKLNLKYFATKTRILFVIKIFDSKMLTRQFLTISYASVPASAKLSNFCL